MEIGRRQNTNRLRYYQPYAKQTAFHAAGATFRERLFMAGNQLGKTLAGAAEAAMHLTGEYPSWWAGRRFERPITMIGGSESHELTRDGVQRLLVGPPMSEEDWGTGYLPKSALAGWTRRSSASGALDSVTVRHASGGTSTLLLKAYEQGRAKWQANTVDYVWFDEEPPEDVYFEGITRTNATGGSVAVTFTPLKGMSSVVSRYAASRAIINGDIRQNGPKIEAYGRAFEAALREAGYGRGGQQKTGAAESGVVVVLRPGKSGSEAKGEGVSASALSLGNIFERLVTVIVSIFARWAK